MNVGKIFISFGGAFIGAIFYLILTSFISLSMDGEFDEKLMFNGFIVGMLEAVLLVLFLCRYVWRIL